jgi:hypothetical protein
LWELRRSGLAAAPANSADHALEREHDGRAETDDQRQHADVLHQLAETRGQICEIHHRLQRRS